MCIYLFHCLFSSFSLSVSIGLVRCFPMIAVVNAQLFTTCHAGVAPSIRFWFSFRKPSVHTEFGYHFTHWGGEILWGIHGPILHPKPTEASRIPRGHGSDTDFNWQLFCFRGIVSVHVCLNLCVCVCVRACVRACMHARVHMCVPACLPACVCLHSCIPVNVALCVYVILYIYTDICTYIYLCIGCCRTMLGVWVNSVREDEKQILFVVRAKLRRMCEFSLEFLQSAPFHSVALFSLAFSKMDKSKARVSFLASRPWQHSQDTSQLLAASSDDDEVMLNVLRCQLTY